MLHALSKAYCQSDYSTKIGLLIAKKARYARLSSAVPSERVTSWSAILFDVCLLQTNLQSVKCGSRCCTLCQFEVRCGQWLTSRFSFSISASLFALLFGLLVESVCRISAAAWGKLLTPDGMTFTAGLEASLCLLLISCLVLSMIPVLLKELCPGLALVAWPVCAGRRASSSSSKRMISPDLSLIS